MKRPLFWCCFAFCIALACATWIPLEISLVAAIFVALVSGILSKADTKKMLLVLLCFSVVGVVWANLTYCYNKSFASAFEGKRADIVLTVTSAKEKTYYTMIDGKMVVTVGDKSREYPYKGYFNLVGVINSCDTISFNARVTAEKDGLDFELSFDEIENVVKLESSPFKIYSAVATLKNKISNKIESFAEKDTLGIITAMITSDGALISHEDNLNLKAAGLSHIVVVSGMHLSIIAGLFGGSGAKKKRMSILIIVFVWWFALLIGLTPSIVRSAIMVTIIELGNMFSQKADGLTSLGFAALVICVCSPTSVTDLGFWLSFLATGGIILLSAPLGKGVINLAKLNPTGMIADVVKLMAVTFSAQIATNILLIPLMGEITPWAIIANPFAAVIVTFLLPLCWINVLLPFNIRALSLACNLLAEGILKIARPVATLPYSVINIDDWYMLLLIGGAYLILILLINKRSKSDTILRSILMLAILIITSNMTYTYFSRENITLLLNSTGTFSVALKGKEAVAFVGNAIESDFRGMATVLEKNNVTEIRYMISYKRPDDTWIAMMNDFDCQIIVVPLSNEAKNFCDKYNKQLLSPKDDGRFAFLKENIEENSITFCFDGAKVIKYNKDLIPQHNLLPDKVYAYEGIGRYTMAPIEGEKKWLLQSNN